MCVILSCEKDKPSLKLLKKAERYNSDGAGIAWIKDGRVHYKKGVNLKAQEIFDMTQSIKPPFVIHFRIATEGGVKPSLCHPFVVHRNSPNNLGGTAKSVLFHNGTWDDWEHYMLETGCRNMIPFPRGSWSDSRAMAWLTGILGPTVVELSKEKAILFDKDGPHYYGEENDWVQIEGILASNDDFLGWKYRNNIDYNTDSDVYYSGNFKKSYIHKKDDSIGYDPLGDSERQKSYYGRNLVG